MKANNYAVAETKAMESPKKQLMTQAFGAIPFRLSHFPGTMVRRKNSNGIWVEL
jgi:hypothetical protein